MPCISLPDSKTLPIVLYCGCDDRYRAKMVAIDETKTSVLVHFDKWSSRFDEWIDMKSDRLKPAYQAAGRASGHRPKDFLPVISCY